MSSQRFNPLVELMQIYEQILEKHSFEEYEKYASILDQLYNEINGMKRTEGDLEFLDKVRELHEQIIHFITLEKEKLGQEIIMFNRKKRVTQDYGKYNANDVGAFFVDFKK
ncbi:MULTISPECIES: hypothetical protein [Paenibacillus]|uniref:hypothetical protein n=1 Tax=Paenibacillus TaxID=44249 RepID=UPI00048E2518|nr:MULTISPECIES: hypothetical protein [Paenibacillus]